MVIIVKKREQKTIMTTIYTYKIQIGMNVMSVDLVNWLMLDVCAGVLELCEWYACIAIDGKANTRS